MGGELLASYFHLLKIRQISRTGTIKDQKKIEISRVIFMAPIPNRITVSLGNGVDTALLRSDALVLHLLTLT